jgi:hypothetical protein
MAVDVVKKLSKLLQSNSNSQQQKDALQQTVDKLSREDVIFHTYFIIFFLIIQTLNIDSESDS